MATMSSVDPAKINSAIKKLDQIDRGFITSVRKISETLLDLDKGWQSEVKASFMQTWQTDAEAMCEMMEQYEEIYNLLSQAVRDFEQTEQDMLAEVRRMK